MTTIPKAANTVAAPNHTPVIAHPDMSSIPVSRAHWTRLTLPNSSPPTISNPPR